MENWHETNFTCEAGRIFCKLLLTRNFKSNNKMAVLLYSDFNHLFFLIFHKSTESLDYRKRKTNVWGLTRKFSMLEGLFYIKIRINTYCIYGSFTYVSIVLKICLFWAFISKSINHFYHAFSD